MAPVALREQIDAWSRNIFRKIRRGIQGEALSGWFQKQTVAIMQR
jgi:hypothetical protein